MLNQIIKKNSTALHLANHGMVKLKALIIYLASFFSASLLLASSVFANVALYLEPASGTPVCGEEFTTDLVIDATSKETDGSRSFITYDPKVLEVMAIDLPGSSPFYPLLPVKDFSNAGKMTIVGLANDTGPFPSGRGNIAAITFKPVGNGASKVDFVVDKNDKTNSTNVISHANSEDILQETHSATYTVSGCTSTGAPSELPKAGNESFVILFASASLGLLFAGVIGYKLNAG